MSLFDRPLSNVTRSELQELLDGAESEPLLWEAKGTEIHKDAVRKAVCAFANGDEPGYLFLGVEEAEGSWVLSGFRFDGDPINWVSGVVRAGVSPVPKFDVRVIPGESEDRKVVIVQVDPISSPPCFARGTIFERIPGSSVTVKDPMRLSQLYRKGEAAKTEARLGADDLCEQLMSFDHGYEGYASHHLSFTVALSSTGKPKDISSELFSESFERSMTNAVREHLLPSHPMPDFVLPVMRPHMTQSSMIVSVLDRTFMDYKRHWWVQVRWDGSVGVHYWTEIEPIALPELAGASLSDAMASAFELLSRLGGFGEFVLTTQLDGGSSLKKAGGGHLTATVRRGPIALPADQDLLPSIERELARAIGLSAYEIPSSAFDSDTSSSDSESNDGPSVDDSEPVNSAEESE